MSTTYVGVPGNVSALSVAVPADGDSDAGVTFAGIQALQDQTALALSGLQALALGNWTAAGTPPSAHPVDVAGGLVPGLVAAMNNGSVNHWSLSTDGGKTWANQSSAATTGAIGVLWVPSLSLFIGNTTVGSGSTVGIETSPQGTAWTLRTVPTTTSVGIASIGNSLAFGAGVIVACQASGQVISSPDGTTWTARGATPMTGKTMVAVAFGGSTFVALASDGTAYTSPDGLTWTSRGASGAGTASAQMALVYNPRSGVFLAANGGTGAIATSPDGITWTSRSAFASTLGSVAYAWGAFVAIAATSGYSDAFAVWTSYDGVTFTQLSMRTGLTVANVAAKAKLALGRLWVGSITPAATVVLYYSLSMPNLA